MLINKKSFSGFCSLFVLLITSACSNGNDTSLHMSKVKLVQVDHPTLLKVSISSQATKPTVVSFDSSDTSILKVAANCTIPQGGTSCTVIINGNSFGEATVTATSSSFSSATTGVSSIENPIVFFIEPNLMCYHEHQRCIPFTKL